MKGKVEEDRYEGFVSYNFPLTNLIRSEIAMNYEWSEISQSGDVELSREFQYWKPRIDFKWDYRKNRQVRFSILRNVGQINFDDFISSFDQFEERIRAGNPDLKPSTAWEINLEHEWRLANDGGVITLTGFASQIDGPVERVPVGGYAAVGNLGTGEITQAIRVLERVIIVKPDYAKAYNQLGIAHEIMQNLNKSIEYYLIAQKLYSKINDEESVIIINQRLKELYKAVGTSS